MQNLLAIAAAKLAAAAVGFAAVFSAGVNFSYHGEAMLVSLVSSSELAAQLLISVSSGSASIIHNPAGPLECALFYCQCRAEPNWWFAILNLTHILKEIYWHRNVRTQLRHLLKT